MPCIKVARLSEVPPDSVVEVSVGENLYAICNVDGQISALSGVCLHQGGPLGQGQIADGRVVCPWHAWEFDCRTGANTDDPARCVPTFPIQIDGDDILLQVP